MFVVKEEVQKKFKVFKIKKEKIIEITNKLQNKYIIKQIKNENPLIFLLNDSFNLREE